MTNQFECVVCENVDPPFVYTDLSGEAMCGHCGCPYQVKWGSDEQQEEGDYPYLNLKEEWVEVFSEYYEETGKAAELGHVLSRKPKGVDDFVNWVKFYHPELLEE